LNFNGHWFIQIISIQLGQSSSGIGLMTAYESDRLR